MLQVFKIKGRRVMLLTKVTECYYILNVYRIKNDTLKQVDKGLRTRSRDDVSTYFKLLSMEDFKSVDDVVNTEELKLTDAFAVFSTVADEASGYAKEFTH